MLHVSICQIIAPGNPKTATPTWVVPVLQLQPFSPHPTNQSFKHHTLPVTPEPLVSPKNASGTKTPSQDESLPEEASVTSCLDDTPVVNGNTEISPQEECIPEKKDPYAPECVEPAGGCKHNGVRKWFDRHIFQRRRRNQSDPPAGSPSEEEQWEEDLMNGLDDESYNTTAPATMPAYNIAPRRDATPDVASPVDSLAINRSSTNMVRTVLGKVPQQGLTDGFVGRVKTA
ncbi:hypothetical protein BDW02DRAFT_574841 [Decorospora gaudefroyi]|uniref:Uncharacterized protein n=1 Tax=Decorospora gaudefroyi TaxID=184978 RepID=A0A6A5K2N2_9PLEO|nr:hypothetical protein BDW02DRAFT_574841 [Decorospora gaudefroyi]